MEYSPGGLGDGLAGRAERAVDGTVVNHAVCRCNSIHVKLDNFGMSGRCLFVINLIDQSFALATPRGGQFGKGCRPLKGGYWKHGARFCAQLL